MTEFDPASSAGGERATRRGEDGARTAGLEPNGATAAALLAAGFACAFFGLLVVLSEASHAVSDFLTFWQGAGPLSGKGVVATGAWLAIWAALQLRLRGHEVPWRPTLMTMWILVGTGLVLTFPPVFQLFAAGGP